MTLTIEAAYDFDGTGTFVDDVTGNGHGFDFSGFNMERRPGLNGEAVGKTGPGLVTISNAPFAQSADWFCAMWMIGPDGSPPDGVWWGPRYQVNSINSGARGLLQISGAVGAQFRNASTFVRPSTTAPTDGLWHHYAGVYDSAAEEARLYVDAVLMDSLSLAPPLRTDADLIDFAEWDDTVDTLMDELVIGISAPTQSEIQDLMNNFIGSPAEPGTYVFDGTSWALSPGPYLFDGSSWNETP